MLKNSRSLIGSNEYGDSHTPKAKQNFYSGRLAGALAGWW